MVASSHLEQAVCNTTTFRQGYIDQENMQRLRRKISKIATSKALHRPAIPLCSIAAGELERSFK
jgi:hypothetical protein